MSAAARTPRVPKQERSRFTREALVEATSQLVDQLGAQATTTTLIAERAGVSVGTLYQYFASREGLFVAAAAARAAEHLSNFRRSVSGRKSAPLESVVRACVRSALELSRARPRLESELAISLDERGLELDRVHDRLAVRVVSSTLRRYAPEVATDAHPVAALIVVCAFRYVTMCWYRDRERFGGDETAFEAAMMRMTLRYLRGSAAEDSPVNSPRPFRTDWLREEHAPSGPNLPTKIPRQRRSVRTVDALLRATRRALANDGMMSASVRSLARTAGVGVGTLYQYFPAKEALTRAVVEAQMRCFFVRYEEALSRSGQCGLGELLDDCLRATLEDYRRTPELMSVLVRTGPNIMGRDPNRTQDHRCIHALIPALSNYGERLAVEDVGLAALFAVGTVRYSCLLWARDHLADSSPVDDDRFRHELVTAILSFLLYEGDPELIHWCRRT